jgi:alpha-L-fucosidase 2
VAIVAVLAMMWSMVSIGGTPFFGKLWTQTIGDRKMTQVDTEREDGSKNEVDDHDESEVYEEIKNKFGVDAVRFLKKPDEETCTSEMNDKAAEVEAARENLQKVTVDISELTAKAISSEGYTKESFEALQQGIREAEVLLNGTYTQDEVNEKTAILKQRISGLRADKTALQEKYDKIKDMTQGQATDESWKEFTGLREQAKNVLDNPNATPNEVSEILEKLNKFEFTYKDKESGEEDKKDPNPGTSGDSEQQGTSDTSHKKESVKTGDTTAIAVPVAGIVGVAVLLYVMRKRRKIES